MEENKNMVRWTDEERALLAHFVRVAVEEKGYTVREGCEFASKKLGRSKAACEWQYQTYIKPGRIKPVLLEDSEEDKKVEQEIINTDSALEIDYLKTMLLNEKAEKTELMSKMSNSLSGLEETLLKIKKNTLELTEVDIIYNINLVRRILIGKL